MASHPRNATRPNDAEVRARRVAETFSFDAVIQRYRRDFGVDEATATRNMRELARFLALGATAPDPDVAYPMLGDPSGLDGAWHTFLLFTRRYTDFCAGLGRYVHHAPEETSVAAGDELLTSAEYVDFLRRYRVVFGEPAPSDLWPRCDAWHLMRALVDQPQAAS